MTGESFVANLVMSNGDEVLSSVVGCGFRKPVYASRHQGSSCSSGRVTSCSWPHAPVEGLCVAAH